MFKRIIIAILAVTLFLTPAYSLVSPQTDNYSFVSVALAEDAKFEVMELTALERLATLHILPVVGSILQLRALQELRTKLGLSAEEIAEYGVVEVPGTGTVSVKKKPKKTKKTKIYELDKKIIQAALRKASGEERLLHIHVGIWDKFIGEEE